MGDDMASIKGLATGIGSLPHTDVDAALDLIFKYAPHIPFWPQLPKRDKREGMIAQFCEGLPCIKVSDKGIVFNPENKEKELEAFYEHIIPGQEDVDYFKISEKFALGLHRFYQRLENSDLKHVEYIKCHVTGPFTMAASIKDENGVVLLHDPEFMQAVSKAVAMKAAWQVEHFTKFGKKMIVFYDEPYLGCFGSAYTPINREVVVNSLAESGEDLRGVIGRYLSAATEGLTSTKDNLLLGVHCCGNTDWSIFTEIRHIDIISFDAFNFLDRVMLYAKDLIDFFKRAGILAWGVVPTQGFGPEINCDILRQKLQQGFNSLINKGIEENLLRNRLIFTPSCGLGTLDPETAGSIFKCLHELADNFKNKSI